MDSLLTGANLFYPSAKDWMWNYCIYLGPFTDSEGNNYDLGIHLGRLGASAAIVYGDEPGEYISGGLKHFGRDGGVSGEYYEEVRKRAKALNIYEDE
jgi:hypothetical protein